MQKIPSFKSSGKSGKALINDPSMHSTASTGRSSSRVEKRNVQSLILHDNRISQTGLVEMFDSELAYCIKSLQIFAATSAIGSNSAGLSSSSSNSQLKLVTHQLINLFKKYDGHLDEITLLTKYIESGENILEIKGFHSLAMERCFEAAKARMDGNVGGGPDKAYFSMESISALAAEPEETPIVAPSATRIKLGNQLMDYFNLGKRVYFGLIVGEFSEILEFDFALKSSKGIGQVRGILKSLYQEAVSASRNGSDAHWVVYHSIYHSLHIQKYLVENLGFVMALLEINWISDLLLQSPGLNSAIGCKFVYMVHMELYQMYRKATMDAEAERILKNALILVTNLEYSSEDKYLVQSFINKLKVAYLALKSKSSSSSKAIDFLSTLHSFSKEKEEKAFQVEENENWTDVIKGLILSTATLTDISERLYSYDYKKSGIQAAKNHSRYQVNFSNLLSLLPRGQRLEDLPDLINCPPEPEKINLELLEEVKLDEIQKKKSNFGDKKKLVTVMKDENEGKTSWQIDFETVLKQIESRSEKFSFVVECLLWQVPSLYRINSSPDKLSPSDASVAILLALGFELFTAMKDEKKSHFSVSEGWNNQLILEIFTFTLCLYQYKQWNNFNETAGFIFKHSQVGDHYFQLCLELKLRIAAVNFSISFQNDRKVLFESNLDGKATPTDIRVTKFDLSDDIKLRTVKFCQLIANCTEVIRIKENQITLIWESINLIWTFMEPFVREFKSARNSKFVEHLEPDDPLLLAIHFLHSSVCRIYFFPDPLNIIHSAGISHKLSLIYESLELYELAVEVLEDCEKKLTSAREVNLGSAYNFLEGVTVDVSFHKEEAFEKLSSLEDEWSALRREVSSLHTDVTFALNRCLIMDYRQKESAQTKLREREMAKLKHVSARIEKALLHTDDTIKFYSGHDYQRRAIFLLAILTADHNYLNQTQKFELLSKVKENLIHAKDFEFDLLTQDEYNSPIILRKGADSLSVSLPAGNTKQFHLHCALAGVLTEKSGYDILGTAISHSPSTSKVTLYNLKPNHRYEISFFKAATGSKTKSMTKSFLASLPLNLSLCWIYLSQTAFELQGFSQFLFSAAVLEDHFLPVDRNSEFHLKEKSLKRATGASVRGFVETTGNLVIHRDRQFCQSQDAGNIVLAQKMRLEFSVKYATASKCAAYIKNGRLELYCAIKAFEQLRIFLEEGIEIEVIRNVLQCCYKVFIKQSAYFESDGGKGLGEFLVPVAYAILQTLLKSPNEKNLATISEIIQDTTSVINIASSGIDTKLYTSSTTEFSLIGYNYKPPPSKSLKKGSTYYLGEYAYHGILASTKPSKAGLLIRSSLEIYFDQLEIFTAKNKLLDGGNNKKINLLGKKAVENFTTLKEIYYSFAVSGGEVVFQELTRFKKNPRYVEIMSELIILAVDRDSPDLAIRFGGELEEWLDRRSQAILGMNELLADVGLDKKEVVLKRARKPMFFLGANIKELIQTNIEQSRNLDSRSRRSSTTSVKRAATPKKQALVIVDKSAKPQPLTRPNSSDKISHSSGSASGASRPSSRGERAASPKENANPTSGNSVIVKKKKPNFKQTYFAGMSAGQKEAIEKAVKILDTHLSLLRSRKAYQMRLRSLLQFEMPWRSNVMFGRARGYLSILRKENKSMQAAIDYKENQNIEFFEFRRVGAFLVKHFSLRDLYSVSFDLYQAQNSVSIEMLQCFAQSIVLAGRGGEHLKVIKYGKSFWNAIRYLLFSGKLDSEFWRLTLWRGMMVVGETIISTLNSIQILRFICDNQYLNLNAGSFKGIEKGKFHLKTSHDLFEGKFAGFWKDRQGNIQIHQFDVLFCGEYLMFTIEIMNASRIVHRLHNFASRVQNIFEVSYGAILIPFLKSLNAKTPGMQQQLNAQNDNRANPIHSALQLRFAARLSGSAISNIIAESDMSQIVDSTINLYKECIELSDGEKNKLLHGTTCLEIGDFLFASKRLAGAAVNWAKGIDVLVGKEKVIQNWRKIFNFKVEEEKKSSSIVADTFGGSLRLLFACANGITKIARYVYLNNHDEQIELLMLAANLITSGLSSNISQPQHFYNYTWCTCDAFLQQDIFRDKFILDASQFLDNILFISKELNQVSLGIFGLPLLSLAEFIAVNYMDSLLLCNNIYHVKIDTLVQLGNIKEAFLLLYILSKRLSLRKKAEDYLNDTDLQFENESYPLTPSQFLNLKLMLNVTPTEKLRNLMPLSFSYDFEFSKAKIALFLLDHSLKNRYCVFHEIIDSVDNFKDTRLFYVEVLDILYSALAKIINISQLNIKEIEEDLVKLDLPELKAAKEQDSLFLIYSQLLEAFFLLSRTCFHMNNVSDALKWSISVNNFVSSLKQKDLNIYNAVTRKLGKGFFVSNRIHAAECLLTLGSPEAAYNLINIEMAQTIWKSSYFVARLLFVQTVALSTKQLANEQAKTDKIFDVMVDFTKTLNKDAIGMVLLPKIYDFLTEAAPSNPSRTLPEYPILAQQTEDSLMKLYFGDTPRKTFICYPEEALAKLVRQRIQNAFNEQNADQKNRLFESVLELFNENGFKVHKQYLRRVAYVFGGKLMEMRKTDEKFNWVYKSAAEKFLKLYLQHSTGMEMNHFRRVQDCYIMISTLDLESSGDAVYEKLMMALSNYRCLHFKPDDQSSIIPTSEIPSDLATELENFRLKTLNLDGEVLAEDLLKCSLPGGPDPTQPSFDLATTPKEVEVYTHGHLTKLKESIENELYTMNSSAKGLRYNDLSYRLEKLCRYLKGKFGSMYFPPTSLNLPGLVSSWLNCAKDPIHDLDRGIYEYGEKIAAKVGVDYSDSTKNETVKAFQFPRGSQEKTPKGTLSISHTLVIFARIDKEEKDSLETIKELVKTMAIKNSSLYSAERKSVGNATVASGERRYVGTTINPLEGKSEVLKPVTPTEGRKSIVGAALPGGLNPSGAAVTAEEKKQNIGNAFKAPVNGTGKGKVSTTLMGPLSELRAVRNVEETYIELLKNCRQFTQNALDNHNNSTGTPATLSSNPGSRSGSAGTGATGIDTGDSFLVEAEEYWTITLDLFSRVLANNGMDEVSGSSANNFITLPRLTYRNLALLEKFLLTGFHVTGYNASLPPLKINIGAGAGKDTKVGTVTGKAASNLRAKTPTISTKQQDALNDQDDAEFYSWILFSIS